MGDHPLELVPFADEHLAAAGGLLAERHRRHRAVEPLLAATYEDGDAARVEVAAAWRADGATGSVALTGGRAVGFLIGAPRAGAAWGPNVWVEPSGYAVLEPEVARDLYAHAAATWVRHGATSHYAVVPGDAVSLDPWFRLGFGQQQELGLREVPPATDARGPVEVRAATVDDVDDVLRLDVLGEHQASSPTFAPGPAADPEEARAELVEELADQRAATFVAELHGRPVGIATVAPVEYSGLHTGVARPAGACILGYAATLPEARGAGVGSALTAAVFAWARENGYTTVVVDWRVTNLLASRFWPARGFRTSFVRVHRSIG